MIHSRHSVRSKRILGAHKAFTLVEMLVMMTIFTTAAATSIAILSHLATISKKTTSHSLLVREVHRLAAQLRDDVHGCESATLQSEGEKLRLLFADGSTTDFELSDRGVLYQRLPAKAEDANASNATVVNDRFIIEPHEDWRFTVNERNAIASLLLRPASGERLQWQIDAAIAVDNRGDSTPNEK